MDAAAICGGGRERCGMSAGVEQGWRRAGGGSGGGGGKLRERSCSAILALHALPAWFWCRIDRRRALGQPLA